ncbi:MAG: thioredoxin domain-containing protein [Patescibacteria group bacterium]|jgi:predicted DsbA family dithiol-disulfide isomerase|nr:thioredoxin domain-containing protein [Patescibacteria group bacterium]
MQKENIKISSFVFITFSLSAFAVVSFLYLFLSSRIHYTQADKKVYAIEEVYYNENINYDDPYLTKASGFKNSINGPIISNFDPYLGDFDAPVKIIVYSDFTCRYCLEQEQIIKNVLKKYSGSVRYIWKDYPESNIDSLSFKASLSARCAQNQDKFWEFHDSLFANNTGLNEEGIFKIANRLDLDIDSFKTCFNEKKALPLILSNIEEANAIGIIGVPNVYINDKEFIGSVSEEEFSMIIENELKDD